MRNLVHINFYSEMIFIHAIVLKIFENLRFFSFWEGKRKSIFPKKISCCDAPSMKALTSWGLILDSSSLVLPVPRFSKFPHFLRLYTQFICFGIGRTIINSQNED